MRTFSGGRGEIDGDALSKSTFAGRCFGAAITGMDTKLQAIPGSSGEFVFGGAALGF